MGAAGPTLRPKTVKADPRAMAPLGNPGGM